MFKKRKYKKDVTLSKDPSPEDASKVIIQHRYCINGVQVEFPVKAYPTQISMMNKILQGLERQQNCLLESPTGSGKSLALLCSCLAWQQSEKKRINAREMLLNDELPEIHGNIPNKNDSENIDVQKVPAMADVIILDESSPCEKLKRNCADSEDDDFTTETKQWKSRRKSIKQTKSKPSDAATPTVEPKTFEWEMEMKTPTLPNNDASAKAMSHKENTNEGNNEEKVPRIYFGTRTHKQIKQIIRELRKTVYKDVRMSILGSREFLCIHPRVSKGKDKNEECKKLVKGTEGGSCRFHNNYNLFSKRSVQAKHKLDEVWDIEDLVVAGKALKACPYFGSRELVKGAEIIFCPYNYLVDPLIRGQMSINIKNQIIVLDEAHNIEDTARESASIILTMLSLEETKQDIQDMINAGVMTDSHTCLQMLIDGLLEWMNSLKTNLERRGFENEAKVWTGNEIAKMFGEEQKLKLTQPAVKIYKEQLSKIVSIEYENNNDGFGTEELKLSSKSLTVIEHIMFILQKLLDEEKSFAADYRVALSRTSVMSYQNMQLPGGWIKKSKQPEKVWTYKLNFWCLNPAVVFSELEASRCVILSSGTLSPMSSFSSELGVKFPITLEANHVIADSQVWVGNLTVGPSNTVLNANYKNSETFAFQDDIGKILDQICKSIPKGVLCFFPSYSMLEKLSKRWKSTSLWRDISSSKVVLSEPRGGDKNEFDEVLTNFYDCIAMQQDKDTTSVTGALLLAVCRGKVSEGLDFSDDNARAVITIGIPFPNFKDLQVELKRKYNNEHCAKQGLLNGSEWYDIQAFRALNQALGRCIRHKNDWGALLIIDERFSKSPKYRNGLSKWVRSKVNYYHDFQACLLSMSQFSDNHVKGLKSSHVGSSLASDSVAADSFEISEKPYQQSKSSIIQTPIINKAVVEQLVTNKKIITDTSVLKNKSTSKNNECSMIEETNVKSSQVKKDIFSCISNNTSEMQSIASKKCNPLKSNCKRGNYEYSMIEETLVDIKLNKSKSEIDLLTSKKKNTPFTSFSKLVDTDTFHEEPCPIYPPDGEYDYEREFELHEIPLSQPAKRKFSFRNSVNDVNCLESVNNKSLFSFPNTTMVLSTPRCKKTKLNDTTDLYFNGIDSKTIVTMEQNNNCDEDIVTDDTGMEDAEMLLINSQMFKPDMTKDSLKNSKNESINIYNKKSRFTYPLKSNKKLNERNEKCASLETVKSNVDNTSLLLNQSLIKSLSEDFKKKPISNHMFKSFKNNSKIMESSSNKIIEKVVVSCSTPLVQKSMKENISSPVLFDDKDKKLEDSFHEEFFDLSSIYENGENDTVIKDDNNKIKTACGVSEQKQFSSGIVNITTKKVERNFKEEPNLFNCVKSKFTNGSINKKSNLNPLSDEEQKSNTKNKSAETKQIEELNNTLDVKLGKQLGVRRSKRTKRRNLRISKRIGNESKSWIAESNEEFEDLAKEMSPFPKKEVLCCKSCLVNLKGTDYKQKNVLDRLLPFMEKSFNVYHCLGGSTINEDTNYDFVVLDSLPIELNSYYDTANNLLYVLVYCRHCVDGKQHQMLSKQTNKKPSNSTSPIGVKMINMKEMKYSFLLYEDRVTSIDNTM